MKVKNLKQLKEKIKKNKEIIKSKSGRRLINKMIRENKFNRLDGFWFCYENEFDMIKALINKGADVDTIDDDGWTALHYVSCNGNLCMAKYLIKKGCDINIKDNCDRTPLFVACEYNNFEIAKLLIANDANVNETNNKNETTLYLAICNGNLDMVNLLINNGYKITKEDVNILIEKNMIDMLNVNNTDELLKI